MQQNTPLRTPEMYERYKNAPVETSCFICTAPHVSTFGHWKLIQNTYPYDAIATEHDMLVPYRHVSREADLTKAETDELHRIYADLDGEDYDAILKNFSRAQTHPTHLHYHLLIFRRF